MANTTNFNWETPDDTDLVKDGAAAIRTLGSAIDTSLVDLKGGTTGQVLSKATNTDMDFTWVAQDDSNAIQNTIVDAKGDLIGASAADTPARLAVGTNGKLLMADSAEATGLKWATDPTADVITTAGDLLYGTAADTVARLGIGTAGQVLTVNSGATAPEWKTASSGALTLVSATSFSGVASHSVNNCFTSTYLNYKIIINYTSATGSGVSATMKFRASSTDTSANYKTCRISGNTSGSGVSADNDAAGTDELLIGLIETGYNNRSFIDMTVYNPQASVPTAAEILSMGINSGNFVNMTIIGAQTDSTAFDGLTILASSGNMTGTIKIYGLQNS